MKDLTKEFWFCFIAAAFLGVFLVIGFPLLADTESEESYVLGGVDPDEPQILVTVEYMTFDQLMQPEVMALAKRHNLLVAPNIRAHYLNDKLDEFLTAYEDAGIQVVFWPLLPREECLYLNEKHAEDFLDHLDKIYDWAEEHDHKIEAMVVDIEPPNCQEGTDRAPEEAASESGAEEDLGQIWEMMDKEEFETALPKFKKVLAKLHEHDTVAISTAMDYAAVDLVTGQPVAQDIAGGPALFVDWDYVSFMNFGSQNTAFLKDMFGGMGMEWDVHDTRYLSYLICKTIAGEYGNRAAISLGQTIPGEGHGAVWEDPAELGKDAAACKAAGIVHFGIYDFQGIVESDDPDAWVRAVKNAEPEKPDYSVKAATLWNFIKTASTYGAVRRAL